MENAFFLKPEEYQRDINILEHAISQSALYLQKKTGKPIEVCKEFVRNSIGKGGKREIKNPVMRVLKRNSHGDREKLAIPFLDWHRDVTNRREVIAGTFTTYHHADKMEAEPTGYITLNVKARGEAKHKMFEAIANKDEEKRLMYFTEQNGKKTTNNALSGAQASKSTALHNVTGHSTLTSTCRMTSGYGNANNEKFVAGNRHYHSYDILLNNIMSIIDNTDYNLLNSVIAKYGLVYPTAQDCLDCALYSTNFYWKSEKLNAKLLDTFSALTPAERAAFVYTGDFYHIAKHNRDAVRLLLKRISTRVDEPIENPDQVIKQAYGAVKTYACLICTRYLKGTKLEDIKDKIEYQYYASTVKGIMDTINDYFDFFRAFLVTANVPASVSYFPDSTRRVVVASDTDSTIYTVQDWVKWYFGEILFTEEANAISDAMVFLSAQSIVHVLARMSANIGVSKNMIFKISMKNEYKFDVFVPTNVGKHYFAVMSSQEGIIFDKLKKEIKGVHLKSSSAPKEITKQAEKLMLDICDTIMAGQKIDLKAILKQVADVEREIYNTIVSGSPRFFRRFQIKPASSYKKGADTPAYKQYEMWNEIFGPKYGLVQEPPYGALKINVSLDNPSGTNNWLCKLQDKELAKRAIEYIKKQNKTFLGGTIYIPETIARSQGLPVEIIQAIQYRELIKDATNVFYIILETLGVYMINDKITRLVMDTH